MIHKRQIFTIESNERLTRDTWRMQLAGDTRPITAAGQFVNIAVDGHFLRRPISVCDVTDGRLTLVYKVVGDGTAAMSHMEAGRQLDMLVGLGNGFATDSGLCRKPVIVGGGVGAAPLYNLAKRLKADGREVQAALGFNTAADIFHKEELEALGVAVHIATMDGSAGVQGFVTAILDRLDFDYVYCCGPMPMMRAVCEATQCSGQYSFEERMGCGFGACMGCTCHTADGPKRICKEGPVFVKEEIVWQK